MSLAKFLRGISRCDVHPRKRAFDDRRTGDRLHRRARTAAKGPLEGTYRDDVPAKRWLRFIDDCGHFLDDGWALRAAELGWTPIDLFGCDRSKPFARIGRCGLLWLLDGRKLRVLTADTALINTASGSGLTFYKRPHEPGQVLAWDLAL